MPTDQVDPGLGLPTTPVAPNPPGPGGVPVNTDPERAHILYTLPTKMVGTDFEDDGFGDEDRSFKMVEVTPRQQDRCAKVANGNASVLGKEMMYCSLWRIGGWRPGRARDRLDLWWKAIGGKGRKLVEAAFLSMQSVEEKDVDSFLASGKPSYEDAVDDGDE